MPKSDQEKRGVSRERGELLDAAKNEGEQPSQDGKGRLAQVQSEEQPPSWTTSLPAQRAVVQNHVKELSKLTRTGYKPDFSTRKKKTTWNRD